MKFEGTFDDCFVVIEHSAFPPALNNNLMGILWSAVYHISINHLLWKEIPGERGRTLKVFGAALEKKLPTDID